MYSIPVILEKIDSNNKQEHNYIVMGKKIFKFRIDEKLKTSFILNKDFFEGFNKIGLDIKNLLNNKNIDNNLYKFLVNFKNKEEELFLDNQTDIEFINKEIFSLIKELTGLTFNLNIVNEINLNILKIYPNHIYNILKTFDLFFSVKQPNSINSNNIEKILLNNSYLNNTEIKTLKNEYESQINEIIKLNKKFESLDFDILENNEKELLNILNNIFLRYKVKNLLTTDYIIDTKTSNFKIKINNEELQKYGYNLESNNLFLNNKNIKRILKNKETIKKYPILRLYKENLKKVINKYQQDIKTFININAIDKQLNKKNKNIRSLKL